MKTNAYISAECIKNDTNPRFSITDVTATIGKATYAKPYNYTFLPVPIIYYPVSTKFELCLTDMFATDDGVPFRVLMPPDFSDDSKTYLVIHISGDKFFRQYYEHRILLQPWAGHPYYFETVSWISITNIESLSTFTAMTDNVEKLKQFYTKRFWRCCVEKDATKYRSAWTNVISFDLSFRMATTVPDGQMEDKTLVTDEDGLLYDGQFYW